MAECLYFALKMIVVWILQCVGALTRNTAALVDLCDWGEVGALQGCIRSPWGSPPPLNSRMTTCCKFDHGTDEHGETGVQGCQCCTRMVRLRPCVDVCRCVWLWLAVRGSAWLCAGVRLHVGVRAAVWACWAVWGWVGRFMWVCVCKIVLSVWPTGRGVDGYEGKTKFVYLKWASHF